VSSRSTFHHAVIACLLVVGVSACSDDESSTDSSGGVGQVGETLAPGATLLPGETGAPQTTFMPDCGRMPTAEALSAAVGVPLDLGFVIATGTCEFRGLNDQTRTVVLSLFTDPADQTTFLDLQSSLGSPVPLGDAELPDALVGANSVVYLTTAEGLYTVLTMVTDATPAEQVPLSVTVLKQWLAL
jgi:hypothetical protein